MISMNGVGVMRIVLDVLICLMVRSHVMENVMSNVVISAIAARSAGAKKTPSFVLRINIFKKEKGCFENMIDYARI